MGVALIVFGILLILGKFGLQALVPYLGVVLIVLGVLILAKVVPGGTLIGAAALVVGILVLGGWLGNTGRWMRGLTGDVLEIINLVLGIVLLILGIQRLAASK